jgi:hypothetical protein
MQKNIVQYNTDGWWFSNELGRKDEFCLNLCDVMSIYDDLPIFYTSCHYAITFSNFLPILPIHFHKLFKHGRMPEH